jgi:hypothetical protein
LIIYRRRLYLLTKRTGALSRSIFALDHKALANAEGMFVEGAASPAHNGTIYCA